MVRFLKLFHFIGLVLFLGSIITFIVVSGLLENAGLKDIAFGRKIISTGTTFLTLPGMWILAVTGIIMGYMRYGIKQKFFQIKFVLIIMILLNAYLFVVPAVTSATELAVLSLSKGRLLTEYKEAYLKESIFGAINVILIISASIVGVWEVGIKSSKNN